MPVRYYCPADTVSAPTALILARAFGNTPDVRLDPQATTAPTAVERSTKMLPFVSK
jgi:plasmid maintenance system antidote protein VapI